MIIWTELFERVASDCDLDRYTVEYCKSRLKKEGLKFWTVTLPKLSKSVLLGLEREFFERPTDFAWKGRSLRYFRSLLDKIFCCKTGNLLPDCDPSAIAKLRQVCEYTYKLSLGFDDQALLRAAQKYLQTQERVRELQIERSWAEELRKNAETYYPALFKADPSVILNAGPRFGPGAFSSAHGSSRKRHKFYVAKQLPDSEVGTCDSKFACYSGYFKPYPGAPTRITPIEEWRTCQVLFVPKDSRGPRVISKEPMHLINAQMAFFAFVSRELEFATQRRINFLDQGVNKRLAAAASVDKRNATLDLKDASDNIKASLVKHIFRNAPGISFFLRNARSTHYELTLRGQRGDLLLSQVGKHSMLAGMGSGLTFPILAFLIHLSICTYVKKRCCTSYADVAKRVYVYGDDVVVPTEWVSFAITALTQSGLMVNTDKSYSLGNFRESCGGDYFKGIDVTPIRLRLSNAGLDPRMIQEGISRFASMDLRKKDNLYVELVKHTHELRLNGLDRTAEYIEDYVFRFLPDIKVGYGSPLLGRLSMSNMEITKQGVWDETLGAQVIWAARTSDIRISAAGVCPYKYLGRLLKTKLRPDPFINLAVASRTGSFGEISVPRYTKIVIRKVPVSSALPGATLA